MLFLYVIRNDRPLTNKEIDVQIALGTLPLWKQIELGVVNFIEIPSNEYSNTTELKLKDHPYPCWYYSNNIVGEREQVIKYFIDYLKFQEIKID